MISVPKPAEPCKLAEDASEAIYYLRPDHIRFLIEVWPHRIDGKQAVCRRCADLAGERDYEAVRLYAAKYGLGCLYALCGEVATLRRRQQAGSVVTHLLVILGVIGLLVAIAVAGG